MLTTTIEQKVPWCLHCGKDKWVTIKRYKIDGTGLPTAQWLGDRQVEARGMEVADDEVVEHCWCSGCGLLYHPDSV